MWLILGYLLGRTSRPPRRRRPPRNWTSDELAVYRLVAIFTILLAIGVLLVGD